MFFVDTIELKGLGNRSYLAGGERSAVVVDPPATSTRSWPSRPGGECGYPTWWRRTSTTTTSPAARSSHA